MNIFFTFPATAGAPGTPRVDKVTPKSVTLSWDKPANDGGGKIQGYIVEVKPKGGDWSDASPYPIKENEFTVPNLKEGEEYQFRVKAVNEAGPGTPSAATGPIVAEKPGGNISIVCFVNSFLKNFYSQRIEWFKFYSFLINNERFDDWMRF